jgi:hypothetical protein
MKNAFGARNKSKTGDERPGYLELARAWAGNSLLCRSAVGDSKHISRRTILHF